MGSSPSACGMRQPQKLRARTLCRGLRNFKPPILQILENTPLLGIRILSEFSATKRSHKCIPNLIEFAKGVTQWNRK
jgi:hypothetical protein